MEEWVEGNNLVASINSREKGIRLEGVVRKEEEENNKSKKSKYMKKTHSLHPHTHTQHKQTVTQ